MRRTPSLDRVAAVALALTLLVAGCTGEPGQGTRAPESPHSPATADETPTPSMSSTATPLESLPSPARCLTDAVPRPDSVDGVEPSTYPEPPTDTGQEAVVGWVQSFESAYFRNDILAGADHDDMNLTRVSAFAEVRAVNRTANGYTIRFSDSGATNYASGVHGDHWSDVGYVVTATRLVRVPLEGVDDEIEASAGTPVVDCEA